MAAVSPSLPRMNESGYVDNAGSLKWYIDVKHDCGLLEAGYLCVCVCLRMFVSVCVRLCVGLVV